MVKIALDVRELEHPKPMEEALRCLQTMDESNYLYMIHHKNPIPLLQLVQKKGYKTLSHQDSDKNWHILITKANLSLEELLDV